MFGHKHVHTARWAVAAIATALLALPTVALADTPSRTSEHVVNDFDLNGICAVVVHAHIVVDETVTRFSDGSSIWHAKHEDTYSNGTRYVIVRSAANSDVAANGTVSTQEFEQLWSADGHLLYVGAGRWQTSGPNSNSYTPNYPDWTAESNVICGQLENQ